MYNVQRPCASKPCNVLLTIRLTSPYQRTSHVRTIWNLDVNTRLHVTTHLGRRVGALAARSRRRRELGVDDQRLRHVRLGDGGWHGDGARLVVRHGDLDLDRVVLDGLQLVPVELVDVDLSVLNTNLRFCDKENGRVFAQELGFLSSCCESSPFARSQCTPQGHFPPSKVLSAVKTSH